MTKKPDDYRLGTLAIHAGYDGRDDPAGSCAVPIYPTSSYHFQDTQHAADLFALKQFGNIYSRLQNPTCDILEKRLAALDGGAAALTFASGMSAIAAAVQTLAQSGQNIISSSSLYGGTYTLFTQTFKKFDIECRFFDPTRPEQIADLADENSRCVYIETIGNPKNDVADFRKVSDIAHGLGLPVLCDNTVATPVLFQPIEHGVDVVVYSTTKFIGGHGLHVGGAVVDGGTFDWSAQGEKWPALTAPDPAYHGVVFTEVAEPLGNVAYILHMRTHWLRDFGAAMSPFAAWLFLIGLETLHLRVPRHAENALAVAKWLRGHPAVEWVNYPGLDDHPCYEQAMKYLPAGQGGIVGFGIKGGRAAGVKFINSVRLASHLANIGDAKTLVIHPASTTHQQLSAAQQQSAGVRPEYIRLSVGIEDIRDIEADLEKALGESQKK